METSRVVEVVVVPLNEDRVLGGGKVALAPDVVALL